MSSHDDPEARIRDLERALSEQSTELTHSVHDVGDPTADAGHRPPPPPHAPPQGAPFLPPMATSTGAGRGWILYAVMAAVTAVIVGGAVMFFANALRTVGSAVDVVDGGSTASGGGGPFVAPPSRSSIGNRPPAKTLVPPEPGGVVNVAGVGEDRTIACVDGVVNVSGVDNRIVITGGCAAVTVSGMENVVTVEASARISASGLNNRVTYLSGSPATDNSGSGNVVERG
jgi:hypothetical protein